MDVLPLTDTIHPQGWELASTEPGMGMGSTPGTPSPLDLFGICFSHVWTMRVWLVSLKFPGFQAQPSWI